MVLGKRAEGHGQEQRQGVGLIQEPEAERLRYYVVE